MTTIIFVTHIVLIKNLNIRIRINSQVLRKNGYEHDR